MRVTTEVKNEVKTLSKDISGSGLTFEGLVFLTPREAMQFLEADAILVDLRDEVWKNGRIFKVNNLISLPFKSLEEDFGILPMDRLLILADYVGIHSKKALRFLHDRGFMQIASLIGGIVEWEKDGLPVGNNHDEELVGGCACQLKPRKRVKN